MRRFCKITVWLPAAVYVVSSLSPGRGAFFSQCVDWHGKGRASCYTFRRAQQIDQASSTVIPTILASEQGESRRDAPLSSQKSLQLLKTKKKPSDGKVLLPSANAANMPLSDYDQRQLSSLSVILPGPHLHALRTVILQV